MTSNLLLNIISFYALVLLLPFALVMLYWKPKAWHLCFALCSGVLMGFVALHSVEPQLPATLLLLFGIFLGSARPRQAWLWGLLLAVWIPVTSVVRVLLQDRTHVLLSDGLGSLLSFAFSFAGSYLGATAAKLSRRPSF